MIITVKKNIIFIDEFKLKCSIGKAGIKNKLREGDKITPKGLFNIGDLYYRSDRTNTVRTNLKTIIIKKNMGWCDDINNKKNYNKLIKVNKNIKHEKLFRKDYKYDFIIPINYNWIHTTNIYSS